MFYEVIFMIKFLIYYCKFLRIKSNKKETIYFIIILIRLQLIFCFATRGVNSKLIEKIIYMEYSTIYANHS